MFKVWACAFNRVISNDKKVHHCVIHEWNVKNRSHLKTYFYHTSSEWLRKLYHIPYSHQLLLNCLCQQDDRWLLLRADLYLRLSPLSSRHRSSSALIQSNLFISGWVKGRSHAVGGGQNFLPSTVTVVQWGLRWDGALWCFFSTFATLICFLQVSELFSWSLLHCCRHAIIFSVWCLESKQECSSVKHLFSVRGNAIPICVMVQNCSK